MAWLADWLLVGWKFVRSFVTRDWTFDDYPVRVEYFPDVLKRWVFDGKPLQAEYHPTVIDRQLRCPPWSDTWFAYVINWPEMSRFGDSADEALADLRTDFAGWKASGEPLPRPGVCPPIEQVSAPRMAEHSELAADFFRRIFNTDYRQDWVSDTVDLQCFHREVANDRYVERILFTYGVDVSDIADGAVVAILERLVALGAWSGDLLASWRHPGIVDGVGGGPPDPEREKRYAAATCNTYTNREIVSSVCRESPRSMSELVRVCSTQVTSQPSAMEVANDTRGISRQVERSARRVGEAGRYGERREGLRRIRR